MALPVIGTKTFTNPTPGGITCTQSHSQTSGNNRGLLLSLSNGNGVSAVSATYNGVAMQKIASGLSTDLSQYITGFWLDNPDSGNHDIVITFSANLWSPVSIACYSFTDCGGVGSSTVQVIPADPLSMVLSCSQDSLIFARGQSFQSASSIVIDGTSYPTFDPLDFQHNANSQAWGKLGVVGVSSGNRTTTLDPISGNCAGHVIEVKGSVAIPTTVNFDYFYRQGRS